MPHEAGVALRMQAFAVAMSAKSGGLPAHDVEQLRTQAEAMGSQSDPLVRSALSFATAFQDLQADRTGLAQAGDDLLAAVERANIPQPPDLGRKDIHG